MELDQYHLVLLRRPDEPPAFTEAELAELQTAHLAYLDKLGDEGLLALNGPLVDQPDETMRGLSFYRTRTAQEAVQLAEQDPMVRAGRLRVELMGFWTSSGSITAPGNRITID